MCAIAAACTVNAVIQWVVLVANGFAAGIDRTCDNTFGMVLLIPGQGFSGVGCSTTSLAEHSAFVIVGVAFFNSTCKGGGVDGFKAVAVGKVLISMGSPILGVREAVAYAVVAEVFIESGAWVVCAGEAVQGIVGVDGSALTAGLCENIANTVARIAGAIFTPTSSQSISQQEMQQVLSNKKKKLSLF